MYTIYLLSKALSIDNTEGNVSSVISVSSQSLKLIGFKFMHVTDVKKKPRF